MERDIVVSRIQHDFVEYAPASHDALDKTLLPHSTFSAFAIAEKNKAKTDLSSSSSRPFGSERETLSQRSFSTLGV